jgi:hypothetical protein
MYMTRSGGRTCSCYCSFFCSLLSTSIGCDASPQNWPSDTFSANIWNALPKEKRYVVYNGLAKSKKLDGLSKKDTVTLLGLPDYTAPDGKYCTYIQKNAEKDEYNFNSIYVLEIDFDAQGQASCYFVRAN